VISGETIPVLLKCYGSSVLPVCQQIHEKFCWTELFFCHHIFTVWCFCCCRKPRRIAQLHHRQRKLGSLHLQRIHLHKDLSF